MYALSIWSVLNDFLLGRYTVHNLHNGGAIFLGLVSIYNDNDAVFNERIPILWSVGYFAVDILDCTLRGDWIYLLHGAFCFGLGLANYTTPLCRQMRMNSKATLCETSNPFMHLAKKTRNPLHFALFAFVFTICRILWLPFLMWQVHQAGMAWTDWRLLGVGAFFGLNFYWYIKIWKILLDGLRGEKVSKAE